MKKLFSFMLMATALLISGQAKAGNCVVKVGDVVQTELTDLKTALNTIAANAGGVYTDKVIDIKVTGDADITPNGLEPTLKNKATGQISFTNNKMTFQDNQKITIDLGDNNTIFGTFFSLEITYGKLEFTGKGTLKTTYSTDDAKVQFPEHEGDFFSAQSLVYLVGSNNCNDANYSSIIIGKNVSVLAPFSYACVIMNNGTKVEGSDKCGSFGAKFVVNGYLSSLFGISVSGNIKHTGCDDIHSNIPEFVVGPNGTTIVGEDQVGLYAAGYARYTIQGTVIGGCGIYAKAGIITIKDNARIEGTASEYKEPEPNGNGVTGGDGCGIVLDSKTGYAGGMEVTIKDNATIIASNGYALFEGKTDKPEDAVDYLAISGGNFEVLNDEFACLSTTEEVKEMVVQNGTITGGVFNTDEVEEYVNHENTVITFYSTEEGEDKWTIGNHPADEWKETLNAAGEGDYVKMKSENAHVEEIPANTTKSIEYLAMLGNDKVIINEGATLIVSAVVLNEDAVIVVKPKATLKIKSSLDNKGGLISTSSDNLIIEADANNYGQLLIDPQVTFNTTPMATVELTSSSYAVSGSPTDYAYQRFGIPMGAQLESIESEDGRTILFMFFDYANNVWKHAGYLNPKTPAQQQEPLVLSAMNKPFGYYQMIINHPTPNTKVTFKGKLAGNTSPVLTAPASQEYVGFANSYVAEMNMSALLHALGLTQQQNVAVYHCTTLGNDHSLTWTPVDELDLTKTMVKPMEAFLIKPADPSKPFSLPLNYQTMIWGE